MVDLHTQYHRIKEEIDIKIKDVLESTAFINGPQVKEFENALAGYLNAKHVISCANGTDALMLALMALNLEPGDEIISPAFTFVATAEAAAFLKLKPVFVDVDYHTFNIDVKALQKSITKKTKAIIPVHLFGQCANMIEILRLAEKNKIAVIEDAAQALGSEYYFPCGTPNKSGTLGNIGCTSFFPSKNLGCFGDGGALYTNNDDLALKLRMYTNHGMQTRYYYNEIGINSRLDTLQAAVLLAKLSYLDEYINSRRLVAQYYLNELKKINSIVLPAISKDTKHTFNQFTIKVKNSKRDALKEHLGKAGIPCTVYYPLALPYQKSFSYLQHKKGDFPVSEQLSEEVLSLPIHTEMEEDQLKYITQTISQFLD